MRFRFRLDPILALRRFDLRRRQAVLAGARAELADGCAREAEALDHARRVSEGAARELAAGVGADPLRTRRQTVEAWRLRAAFAARDVRRIETRVERLSADAIAARTRVEVLERLRERARVRWRTEGERRLQRELDEIAGARWARGREPR